MKKNDKFEIFLKHLYLKDIKQMKKMLDSGYSINEVDEDGRSALMYAILDSEPSIKTIKYLIKHGINLDLQDKRQKWSALHFAARDQKDHIVKLLLENNAKIDVIDVFGNTPLWRAVMHSKNTNTLKTLISFGADIDKVNNNGISPSILADKLGKKLNNK